MFSIIFWNFNQTVFLVMIKLRLLVSITQATAAQIESTLQILGVKDINLEQFVRLPFV
jgi:hypothetical protein